MKLINAIKDTIGGVCVTVINLLCILFVVYLCMVFSGCSAMPVHEEQGMSDENKLEYCVTMRDMEVQDSLEWDAWQVQVEYYAKRVRPALHGTTTE